MTEASACAAPPRFRMPRWKNIKASIGARLVKAGLSMQDDSSVLSHAEHELKLAGWFDEDAFYGDMMGNAVMDMMRLFAMEGHSGMSSGVATSIFARLSRFEPLTPLTGEDEEWVCHDYGDGPHYQNKRCSHVFKDEGGRAYDIQGKIFREPSGLTYTSRDSRVYIEFPYTPKTEYVDVPASKEDEDQ